MNRWQRRLVAVVIVGFTGTACAPTPTPTSPTLVSVQAGSAGSCARYSDGSVRCWGSNTYAALGVPVGTLAESSTPVAVTLPAAASALDSGSFNCVLVAGGAADCWGQNTWGAMGNGTYAGAFAAGSPVGPVTNLTGATQIVTGGQHACALIVGGAAKCWGDNGSRQLGNSPGGFWTSFFTTTVDVYGLSGATQLTAGSQHTCAVTATGGLQCWGSDVSGQLGDNDNVNKGVPVAVSGLSSGVASVSAGGNHTCAVMTTGTVKCWGNNLHGQIGAGIAYPAGPGLPGLAQARVPTDVVGITNAVAVATAADHSCALLADHTVTCWGAGTLGQLGNGANADSDAPVPVSGLTGVVEIDAASFGDHTCALLSSGAVACWGANSSGQLGDGTTTNRNVPVTVAGL